MTAIAWTLLWAYLVLTRVLGILLSRRNRGDEHYFLARRRLNSRLARASLAATTFSIHTPLHFAGLIRRPGLAGCS